MSFQQHTQPLQWRVHDVHSLDAEQLQEYRTDIRESNRRYDRSYEEVLAHTSAEELEEFWDLFKGGEEGHMPIGLSRTHLGSTGHMATGQRSGQQSPTEAQTEVEVEAQANPLSHPHGIDGEAQQGDFSVANPMRGALQQNAVL